MNRTHLLVVAPLCLLAGCAAHQEPKNVPDDALQQLRKIEATS